ncbi:PKD domain-containing protein, partial [archaeon]|nr:PKD domain-containing protein [archaeon]
RSIVSYTWTEGDTLLGEDKTLGKIFDAGEHTIKVTVKDNTGASAYDTVKVTVTAKETTAPTDAPQEQTSPFLMVLLGVGIGVAIVGAILFYMKKNKGPEDEWV